MSDDSCRSWSVALFAHNEAHCILAALENLPLPIEGRAIEVYVMANGCTDATEEIVRDYAKDHPWVHLNLIGMSDKANAWNEYVHRIAPDVEVHFFTDGDVLVSPNGFEALDRILVQCPSALAAGGFPTTGRNRQSWIRSMMRTGNLAGGLYALPRRTLDRLRTIQFRQPIGWIGEDTLLSWVVHRNLGRPLTQAEMPLVVFDDHAGFTFRSLSPWRVADWRNYWRRKIRYAIKKYQFELLSPQLRKQGLSSIPRYVSDLYCNSLHLPHLSWNGRNTLFDVLALRHIRKTIQGCRKESSESKQGHQQ